MALWRPRSPAARGEPGTSVGSAACDSDEGCESEGGCSSNRFLRLLNELQAEHERKVSQLRKQLGACSAPLAPSRQGGLPPGSDAGAGRHATLSTSAGGDGSDLTSTPESPPEKDSAQLLEDAPSEVAEVTSSCGRGRAIERYSPGFGRLGDAVPKRSSQGSEAPSNSSDVEGGTSSSRRGSQDSVDSRFRSLQASSSPPPLQRDGAEGGEGRPQRPTLELAPRENSAAKLLRLALDQAEPILPGRPQQAWLDGQTEGEDKVTSRQSVDTLAERLVPERRLHRADTADCSGSGQTPTVSVGRRALPRLVGLKETPKGKSILKRESVFDTEGPRQSMLDASGRRYQRSNSGLPVRGVSFANNNDDEDCENARQHSQVRLSSLMTSLTVREVWKQKVDDELLAQPKKLSALEKHRTLVRQTLACGVAPAPAACTLPGNRISVDYHTMMNYRSSQSHRLDRFISNPNVRFVFIWDILQMMLMFWDFVRIPLSVFEFEEGNTFKAIYIVTAVFWTVDIFRNFFVGHFSKGNMVMTFQQVAARYLKTWFPMDISLIVLDWMLLLDFAGDHQTYLKALRVVRLLRSVKTKRILKLMEAVLWTAWTHLGTLHTLEDCNVLSVSADRFAQVVQGSPEGRAEAGNYARSFVVNINREKWKATDLYQTPIVEGLWFKLINEFNYKRPDGTSRQQGIDWLVGPGQGPDLRHLRKGRGRWLSGG